MSKKTWSTILVVVLIVAAAIGIYLATRPAQTPEPTVTEAPTEAPATDATEPLPPKGGGQAEGRPLAYLHGGARRPTWSRPPRTSTPPRTR